MSQGAVSGDRTTNLQGTVNVTHVRGAHTLRGGVDARLAQRQRGLGGNPSGQLSFTNEFTRQASDTVAAHAEQPRAQPGGIHARHPVDLTATIQPTTNLRNHFFAAYAQDSWRLQNLTVNLGLRVEWENGISEDNGAHDRRLRPEREAGDSDLAEAAYARAPIPQLPAADFHVRGGSVYASDPGQDGKVWRPQTMLMPRVSAAYKLGERTVVKGGYGLYYDTLNAADYGHNNQGTARRPPTPTAPTSARRSCSAIPTRAARASPIRSRCAPTARVSTSRPDRRSASIRSSARGYTIQNQNHEHARQQRWRIGVQRELAGTCRWRWPTTARTRIAWRWPSGRTTCRSSSGFPAA